MCKVDNSKKNYIYLAPSKHNFLNKNALFKSPFYPTYD